MQEQGDANKGVFWKLVRRSMIGGNAIADTPFGRSRITFAGHATSERLREAEAVVKRLVSAGPEHKLVTVGAGTTAAVSRPKFRDRRKIGALSAASSVLGVTTPVGR